MKFKVSVITTVLILAALACNMPTFTTIPTEIPLPAPLSATPTRVEVVGTAVADTPVAQPPQETFPEFTGIEACKMYDIDEASQLLGEEVVPPTPVDSSEYSVCTFFTKTGKGIYISITKGDQAKKNFLNEIGQYQKGCSVGYSGGTSTATPFPPEVEALMSNSLQELFTMDIALMEKCSGKVTPLPEFGPDAYLIPGAFNMASVGIVSGSNYYAFSFADPSMDITQMGEKAQAIVRAVLSK